MNHSFHPIAFDISIGGIGGPSYVLKWESDHLVYRMYEAGEQQAVLQLVPSKRSWHLWKVGGTMRIRWVGIVQVRMT